MDATEHSLRRDNARLRDKLAEMGKQRDRAISSTAQEKKEAKRLRAEIERLTALLDEVTEALENVMGSVDTPISRRRLNINDDQPEWLTSSRDTLARIKEPRNGS